MLTNTNAISEIVADSLESYFLPFREGIIGINQKISTPHHSSIPMVYADWTASGRCYRPIEEKLMNGYMPMMANTHTEATASSSYITQAYHQARARIKRHVNASSDDILISYGSGMTDVVNKLQRILGLRIPEQLKGKLNIPEEERPVVFVTHMEHHSNQTSWLETICEVVVVPPAEDGTVSLESFEEAIKGYEGKDLKIAAVTACSNVTGIMTPIHEIAKLIHGVGGYCFADFACSAPYVKIDMHPPNEEEALDAIYFSPHKFLGGPGAPGILLFNSKLYKNTIPDVSGGGTVDWTNPWGGRKYLADIEAREDGGTPPILQTIKAGMAIELKEEMGVGNLLAREEELVSIFWERLRDLPRLNILANEHQNRLGILSFCIGGMHHDEVVKILNNKYGIQSRGGCSCAGTYGHYLLGVDQEQSKYITGLIDKGDDSEKPGWTRISIHPTMTNKEVEFVADAVRELAVNSVSNHS